MAARGRLRSEAAQAKRAAARSDTRVADEERAAAEQRRDAIYADRETTADAEIAEEKAKSHREEAAIFRRFVDKATKGH